MKTKRINIGCCLNYAIYNCLNHVPTSKEVIIIIKYNYLNIVIQCKILFESLLRS